MVGTGELGTDHGFPIIDDHPPSLPTTKKGAASDLIRANHSYLHPRQIFINCCIAPGILGVNFHPNAVDMLD